MRRFKQPFYIIILSVMVLLSGCRKPAGPESATAETSGSAQTTAESSETTQNADPAAAAVAADKPLISMADRAFDGSIVTIAKSGKELATDITETEIEAMVRAAAPDLQSIIKNGQTVVLKPNLVQMKVDSTGDLLDKEVNGITTDWRVTKAIVKLVREKNPDGKVYIMEGSASGPTSKVMEYFHYTPEYMKGVDDFISLEEDCGGWQDFDAPEVVKVDLPDGLLHKTYYFNRILYEADVLISIPCLKTSSGVVVTAGIKNVSLGTPPGNLYGIAPDNPSKTHMVSHKIVDGELDRWIYDYYCAKPIDYVIVDGLQGFQSGPVPMSQERKETDKMNMGVIIGGRDAVAVDTICALTVGWDPESVGYLKLFKEYQGLGYLDQIRVRGAYVDDLRAHFTIKRPELGGVQITDDQGPELSDVSAEVQNRTLKVGYQAGEDTYKLEVLIDGYFFYATDHNQSRQGEITVPDITENTLAKGRHRMELIAYDRYLNRSSKTIDFTL